MFQTPDPNHPRYSYLLGRKQEDYLGMIAKSEKLSVLALKRKIFGMFISQWDKKNEGVK